MKLKLLMRAGAFLLLGCLAVVSIRTGYIAYEQHRAEKATAAFLEAVQLRQFEQAAQLHANAVSFGHFDAFRETFREDGGFRLLTYGGLDAEYDDGCVCTGKVHLTFETNGEPLSVAAIFTVGPDYMPNQVCALTPSGVARGSIPGLSAWNMAFCGGDSF